MRELATDEPLARAVTRAIQGGATDELRQLLAEHPDLARASIRGPDGGARSLLHVATDWPGHFANIGATIRTLVAAGADVGARFGGGRHMETPLHWAASSDDLEALDVLLDAGADIDAPGALIAGGTALDDAVAFAQWRAARRLLERGARTTLWTAAGLGLVERVAELAANLPVGAHEITRALWCACHAGQRETAALLADRGADLEWIGYDELTPLDAALRCNSDDVVRWLRGRGARTRAELG